MSAEVALITAVNEAAATVDELVGNLEGLMDDVIAEAMTTEQKRCLAWLRSGLPLAEAIDNIEQGLLFDGEAA